MKVRGPLNFQGRVTLSALSAVKLPIAENYPLPIARH